MMSKLFLLSLALCLASIKGDKAKCGCGIENEGMSSPSGRGSPLLYPWMGSLVAADRSAFCGVVLISAQHVLTAANCVAGKSKGDLNVVLGLHDFSKLTEGDIYSVSKITVNEGFKKVATNQYDNDLAILELEKPLKLARDLLPICLSTQDGWGDDWLVAIGWGQLSAQPSNVAKVLMQVDIPEVDAKKCSELWRFLQPSHGRMCAGGGRKNVCKGDEGGALMYRKAGRWTLAAITSFSGPTCGDKYPGVFARSSAFVDWITKQATDVDLCTENQV